MVETDILSYILKHVMGNVVDLYLSTDCVFSLHDKTNIQIVKFGLFNIATCFGCPDQPPWGRAWIQIDSKGLEASSCKINYLIRYIITYFLTYLLTHSLTHSLIYFLLNYLLTFLPTYLLNYLLTYLLTPHSKSFFRSWPLLSQPRNSPHFMEPKGSLSHSQVPATCPYPEPARSSTYSHIPLSEHPP
jgi:hypothetical protein